MNYDIKIYVACLAAYNNGILHGAWIDVNKDYDEVMKEVRDMLASSPMPDAEEWEIHDTDCDLPYFKPENYSIRQLCDIADQLENETAEEHIEPFLGWCQHTGNDIDFDAYQDFLGLYLGEFDSEADFCEEQYEELFGEIPESLRYHIDWESMAEEWFINSYLSVDNADRNVYVFIQG